MNGQQVWSDFEEGKASAVARLINLVEAGGSERLPVMQWISQFVGRAHIVGLTGPPGAGKSTLTNQLALLLVKKNLSVGIVCIDPTSPFSGGAFLGDRVRMTGIGDQPGVFIRSMATRGSLGGLAPETRDVVRVLDAAGKDVILIETVGTGQIEHDIAAIADSTVMVTVPGLGDGIQTLKAGIMEIADVFVVNKSDREGSEDTAKDLELMVLEARTKGWVPRVVQTSAINNRGITDVWAMLIEHQTYLKQRDLWSQKRIERNQAVFRQNLLEKIHGWIEERFSSDLWLGLQEEKVIKGLLDPYTAAIDSAEYLLRHEKIRETEREGE